MTDLATWIIDNFAMLVLAGFTAVLAYVTYALKKATDGLAVAQVMPMLIIEEMIRVGGRQRLMVNVANRGFGVGYETKVFGITPTGVKFSIDQYEKYEGHPDIAPQKVNSYYFSVIADIDMEIELECKDANGNYHGWKRTIRTPPELVPPE